MDQEIAFSSQSFFRESKLLSHLGPLARVIFSKINLNFVFNCEPIVA
jgi:hypothetical protein